MVFTILPMATVPHQMKGQLVFLQMVSINQEEAYSLHLPTTPAQRLLPSIYPGITKNTEMEQSHLFGIFSMEALLIQ